MVIKKIRLDELVYTQQEIDEDGLDIYIDKIRFGEPFESIKAAYCDHTGKFYVRDGHHKAYTMFKIFGVQEIIIEYVDCSVVIVKTLDKQNPCVAREEFADTQFSINELKVIDLNKISYIE